MSKNTKPKRHVGRDAKSKGKKNTKEVVKKAHSKTAKKVHSPANKARTPTARAGSPKTNGHAVVAASVMIQHPEAVEGVRSALQDMVFLDYVAKNVGSQANEVLRELSKGPSKDEQLAEKVSVKLNDVRRVLNLLNKHGIVRYDVKRDGSGWLTFEWYVDHVSFYDFYKSLKTKAEAETASLPEDCNDFFVCGKCRGTDGLLYSFEIAYEKSFKCNCGKNLDAITREEALNQIRN